MRLRMRMTVICCLVWLLVRPVLFGAPASAPRAATDVPAAERLITALPQTNALPIPAEAVALYEWPAEALTAKTSPEDRMKTIPPLFRQPKIRDAKPIRLGAKSPKAACKEAEQWIRLVLKPQWVPEDIAGRLRTLQRDPASRSSIVCRYVINGYAIQINQTRGFMWVIIRPPKDTPLSQDAKQLADATFTTYFANGDRMAALQGKATDGTAQPRVWAPDFSAPIPAGALENWWGWQLWLTDSQAVAVLLNKTSEDSARNIMPDDPWF